MGNCLGSGSSRAAGPQKPKGNSDHSRATSKTDSSWQNSAATSSINPSSFTVSSYTASESLPTPRSEQDILSSSNLKAFSFSELKKATSNFKPVNLIGEGGFGYVYKGWVDEHNLTPAKPGSGMVVAVKKLKPEGFQGHEEWLTEVLYLGQLHHSNLVKLIGYCSEGENHLLVYECLARGSLENHLFRRSVQPLSWSVRIKIAVGAARGLAFLHNAKSQVIYRDFKPSNILLDTDFDPKLCDFGLAKAGPTGDRTHVSTRVMGTQGYAAPEYVATGRLSAKADVYSFGVVLLELLSGRPALDKSKLNVEQKLVDWAKPYLDDRRNWVRIMDPRLEGRYPKKGAQEVASLALQCLGNDGKLRPSMTEVLVRLESVQGSRETAKVSQAKQWERPTNSFSPRSPLRQRPSPRHLPSPRGSPLPLQK